MCKYNEHIREEEMKYSNGIRFAEGREVEKEVDSNKRGTNQAKKEHNRHGQICLCLALLLFGFLPHSYCVYHFTMGKIIIFCLQMENFPSHSFGNERGKGEIRFVLIFKFNNNNLES